MDPLPSKLTFVRDLGFGEGNRQQHAAAVALNREVRVSRGTYVPRSDWETLGTRDRYLLLLRAVAATRKNQPILSHWSAAAVHGMPIIGAWPSRVHMTVGVVAGGRSRNGVVKHSAAIDDYVEVDGLRVTTIARTVLDMAVCCPVLQATAMVDFALHRDRFNRWPPLTSHLELLAEWNRRLPFRGHARALAAIEFGSSRADTPIESASRVSMRQVGFPQPRLQTPFSDADGFIGEPDFEWPDFDLLGEADGDRKYLDRAFRSGRTVEQVLLDEKIREDRLRALPRAVGRWRWSTAVNPGALRTKLVRLGLPTGAEWGQNFEHGD
ncbi:MAG: hypothetical protein V4531_07940 [Actinomycetota bacterium]